VPYALRVAVARARRAWEDKDLRGSRPRFARRPDAPATGFDHEVVEVVQKIKGTAYVEGKMANIALGASLLDGAVVAPGEVLSFWALVGCPSAANGFSIGRSIRADMVAGEIGGGLCQVSGIAYEVGLRAGLTVVERFPHSRDLYAEDERFTPLGLDATVVWPYRDLRLRNPHPVPVRFGFVVEDRVLTASVHAALPLPPVAIEIERTDQEGLRHVRVRRQTGGGAPELISDDVYAAMPDA